MKLDKEYGLPRKSILEAQTVTRGKFNKGIQVLARWLSWELVESDSSLHLATYVRSTKILYTALGHIGLKWSMSYRRWIPKHRRHHALHIENGDWGTEGARKMLKRLLVD